MDERAVIDAYVEHLSDADVCLLVPDAYRLGGPPAARAELRAGRRLAALLAEPALAADLFAPRGRSELCAVSPFLLFAVAIEQTARELAATTHVSEWWGWRQSVPVFNAPALQAFLARPQRRFLLAELLASYTRVASGAVLVRTPRGLRRQRFSELDPVRFAALLDLVPEPERPGVLRRLGDLALFLTGVFPDQVARRGFGPLDEQRLRRSAGGAVAPPVAGVDPPGTVGMLEALGRQWYRLAADRLPARLDTASALRDLAENFADARRVLNQVTERHLFVRRDDLFGPSAA